ncbi:hypothetical protein JQC92_02660 [Shewanella sp. 202IG2-18]|uniref:esterase/lipase family protein n=1 Tax=Parashewanella hymeniacidonis TaxID=2807618 RepID=UPI0019602E32|nr:hypothetical protein [Parashewanella hymeniacidonis]MBM7070944.1 hypothetical protein [Parashewanella hymeniacidonis]
MKFHKSLLLLGLLSSTCTYAEPLVDEYGLEINSNHSISMFPEPESDLHTKSNKFSLLRDSKAASSSSYGNTWSIYSKETRRHCEWWDGELPRAVEPIKQTFSSKAASDTSGSISNSQSVGTQAINRRTCRQWTEYPAYTYGTADIFKSYDNVLDKPVVVVQPYIIDIKGSTYSSSQFYNAINAGDLANSLRSAGYDVILYRYRNQDNGVVFNAKGVQRLLEKINEQSGISSTSFIGLSMGGVVARYALADLENKGQLNDVATFISFDAPHLGANFPKSILDNTNRLLDKVDSRICGLSSDCRDARRKLKGVKSKLNTKTFKELIFTINKSERSTLLSQLRSVGHVDTIPTLALTNGAKSKTQGYPHSKLTTHFKLHRKWYNGGSKYFKVNTVPSVDNVAGGYSDFYQELSNLIKQQPHPITPYVTVGQRHSFVSTTSALAGSESNFTEVASYPSSNEAHMDFPYPKRLKIRQWLDTYQF